MKSGARVLDLGAAPGGWSQIARARIGPSGRVVAADILEMEPIAGVEVMKLDLTSPEALDKIRLAIGGEADVVLTDMAAPTTGDRTTDRLRTAALFEAALEVAEVLLKPGGAFAGKIFQGGAATRAVVAIEKRVPASSPCESRLRRAPNRLSSTSSRWASEEDDSNFCQRNEQAGTGLDAKRSLPKPEPRSGAPVYSSRRAAWQQPIRIPIVAVAMWRGTKRYSLIASDKVEGTAVYGPDGDKIGSIENVMIDKLGGRVAYAVLTFGGFLGMGNDYYPLPWATLKYDENLGGYRVNITRDQLEICAEIS